MERINKVLHGSELHPMLEGKNINLSIAIDMKESYKILFEENDYDEFIDKIKYNKEYRKEAIDRLNDRFNLRNYILITNSTYDTWYYVKFIDEVRKNYTLLYVENLSKLNPKHFYEDYIDLFGNKIEFSE
ncbi:MAG: hypothetical protein IJ565_05640 [Bacilli bacterium]|nr:hypothetical protein [Bacilli bacterium]